MSYSLWQAKLALVSSYNTFLYQQNDHFRMVIDNLREAVRAEDFKRCEILWDTFIKNNPSVISAHNPVITG